MKTVNALPQITHMYLDFRLLKALKSMKLFYYIASRATQSKLVYVSVLKIYIVHASDGASK